MSTPRLARGIVALALMLGIMVFGFSAIAEAQATTGALSGVVRAQSDNSPLPGAAVTAIHTPTNTTYSAVAGADGRFYIPNVRVGGPYTVSAALDSFQTKEVSDLTVNLGSATNVDIALPLATVSESISVVGSTSDLINPNRTGSSTSVSSQELASLPTVRRSLQDFARTNPYFSIDSSDGNSTRMFVAGRNNRYNTIQIDGAVDNDLFGLADTGTPGGQADTQPIPIDALSQLQLVVSPYDVRQGGFTGGGLNAVTRSGSNKFEGSVYGSKRNPSYVGNGPYDKPISDFSEDQYGFHAGGPIQQDKLFFFVTGERNKKSAPSGVSADGSTGSVYKGNDSAAELKSFLTNTYNYNPGTLGDIAGKTDSDLAFVRFDWNVAKNHQLTLRHNYVDATRDVIANRSSSVFRFDTANYAFDSTTNSTVAQLNSVFGANSFNEGRLGYQTIREKRAVPVVFPSIEIGGTGPRRGDLIAGTEQFSGANALNQDILELTDDYTFLHGPHTITVGTHNEFFKFSDLFLSSYYGYYYFPTLADFEAGMASQYSIGFANGSNPRRATDLNVRQYGIYGNDQWRVNDRLSLTLGLRADKASFPDTPSENPLAYNSVGYHTAETPKEDPILSPRLGFNWDPDGKGVQQLRGGIGVFAGRTPYVWITNAYQNTGVESTALSFYGSVPFNPDPLNQPHNLGAAGRPSVDLIDPNFEFPRVLRSTLGYDRTLFWGIRGTAEVVWSQTQKDVYYENVNKVPTGGTSFDGRPTYTSKSSALGDAVLLTNTDKGHDLIETIQLSRPFLNGLTMSATYAHMDSNSAFDATSSRAISNWQFMPTRGDIYKPETSTSMFEIKHRFNLSASYNFKTGPVGHTVAIFYTAQSGRPYSLLEGGDPNTDGYTSNDMLYVPGAADQVILKDSHGNVIPYSMMEKFLHSAGVSGTAGRILRRNESYEPWTHELDFHYGIELPIKVVRAELTVDVLNLLNMIDSSYGVIDYVDFQTYTPVKYMGTDSATGKAIYQESFSGALDPGAQYSTNDTRSRWQAKLGLRLSF